MLNICVDHPAFWRLTWWRVRKRRICIEVDRGNPTVVFPFARFATRCLCGTGTDEIGIRQANYPSGKGKQIHDSFDESMSALSLVRLQWQILRADLIRGGLVARRNCSVD